LYAGIVGSRLFGKTTHILRVGKDEKLEVPRSSLAVQEAEQVSVSPDLVNLESPLVREIRRLRQTNENFHDLRLPNQNEWSGKFNPYAEVERTLLMSVLEIALRADLTLEEFKAVASKLLGCDTLLRLKALFPDRERRGCIHVQNQPMVGDGQDLAVEMRNVGAEVSPTMLLRFSHLPKEDVLVELFRLGKPSLPLPEHATSYDWESAITLIKHITPLLLQIEESNLSAYGFNSQDAVYDWLSGIISEYVDNRLDVLSNLLGKGDKSDWQSIANISFQLVAVGIEYSENNLLPDDKISALLKEKVPKLGATVAETLVRALQECPMEFGLFQVRAGDLKSDSDFWGKVRENQPELPIPQLPFLS
jgi:hypothetical protein